MKKVKNLQPIRKSPLGRFLTTRRRELGLSQLELAHRAGTTTDIVTRIERGTYRITDYIIQKISTGLDCRIPEDILQAETKYPNPSQESASRVRLLGKNIKREWPIGQFLTNRRVELGLTQAEVAMMANLTPSVVSGIECGRNRSEKSLSRVAKVLDCEIPSIAITTEALKEDAQTINEQVQKLPITDIIILQDGVRADIGAIISISDINTNQEAVRVAVKLLRIILEKRNKQYSLCFQKNGSVIELELLF